jgi:Tat protein secretion system quality control protein TatD with DNase activity
VICRRNAAAEQRNLAIVSFDRDFCTFGSDPTVEVLYSDDIKEIARAVPDHLLLTKTDNPGALRWLKKNDEIGMPTAITKVVEAVAELRSSTTDQIESLVEANFSRLIANDPWLGEVILPTAIVKQ